MASYEINNALYLAKSSLSEADKKAGWSAGFSEKDHRVYFLKENENISQWESPTTGCMFPVPRSSDAGGRLSKKYQVPKLPNFPSRLRRPVLVPVRHTKGAVQIQEGTMAEENRAPKIDSHEGGHEEEEHFGVKRSISLENLFIDESQEVSQKRSKDGDDKDENNPENEQEEEYFEFPSDVLFHSHLGESEYKMFGEIMRWFGIFILFEEVRSLAIPTRANCWACQEEESSIMYPSHYHACLNYMSPFYKERDLILNHIPMAIRNVSEKIYSDILYQLEIKEQLKRILNGVCPSIYTKYLKMDVNDESWRKGLGHLFTFFLRKCENFYLECYELHEKCIPDPICHDISLQNIMRKLSLKHDDECCEEHM